MIAFAGLILAGGAARRLGGRDKAMLAWEGRTFLETVADALRQAGATELLVAGGTLERARAYASLLGPDARPVADVRADAGPLAGIVAGLAAARAPITVLAPADAPLLPPPFVAGLVAALDAEAGALAAIPVPPSGPHPLNAALRTEACSAATAAAFEAGERSPLSVLLALPHVPLDLASPEPFFDVDEPADLEGLLRRTRQPR